MKKNLTLGFILLFPIALTLMILNWLFDFLTTPFVGFIENLLFTYDVALRHHDLWVLFLSRLIVLVLLFLFAFILGFLTQKYIFSALMRGVHFLVMRIPFVKTIYSLSQDIAKAVFSPQEKTFKQTVLIPFPTEKTYALGLQTGETPPIFKQHIPEADQVVFIPTAPHPIAGFILMAPKNYLIDVAIETEDVFKFLISCGVLYPEQKIKDES